MASTIRRPVCGANTRCCSAVGSRAYSGSTSRVAWVLGDLAQRLGGVADLALAGQEDQDVAGRLGRQFAHGVDDRLGLVAQFGADDLVVGVVRVVAVVGRRNDFQRAVTDLDRIGAAGHLDDRCTATGSMFGSAEVRGESPWLDGRRGDDHLEVGPRGSSSRR